MTAGLPSSSSTDSYNCTLPSAAAARSYDPLFQVQAYRPLNNNQNTHHPGLVNHHPSVSTSSGKCLESLSFLPRRILFEKITVFLELTVKIG